MSFVASLSLCFPTHLTLSKRAARSALCFTIFWIFFFIHWLSRSPSIPLSPPVLFLGTEERDKEIVFLPPPIRSAQLHKPANISLSHVLSFSFWEMRCRSTNTSNFCLYPPFPCLSSAAFLKFFLKQTCMHIFFDSHCVDVNQSGLVYFWPNKAAQSENRVMD